jgi:hypothetical protein
MGEIVLSWSSTPAELTEKLSSPSFHEIDVECDGGGGESDGARGGGKRVGGGGVGGRYLCGVEGRDAEEDDEGAVIPPPSDFVGPHFPPENCRVGLSDSIIRELFFFSGALWS